MKNPLTKSLKKYLLVMLALSMAAAVGCETSEKAQTSEAATAEAAAAEEAATDEAAAESAHDHGEHADHAKHAGHADHGHSPDEAAKEAAAFKKSGLAADLGAGETGTYGAQFSIEEAPITLASAIEKAAATENAEAVYKVEGTIETVCQKKGCWFSLTADGVDNPVRVRMKDYAFFVPRNTGGAHAVVEGTLKKRTIPKAEAQHYADDAAEGTGEKAVQITEDQVGWEMTIVAAKITNHG
jgi:hypothetical protein